MVAAFSFAFTQWVHSASSFYTLGSWDTLEMSWILFDDESDNDNKAKQMVILRSWDPVCSARGCHGSIKWGDAKKLKGTHAIHDAIFKDCIKRLNSLLFGETTERWRPCLPKKYNRKGVGCVWILRDTQPLIQKSSNRGGDWCFLFLNWTRHNKWYLFLFF